VRDAAVLTLAAAARRCGPWPCAGFVHVGKQVYSMKTSMG
jgi:hypothetical protein